VIIRLEVGSPRLVNASFNLGSKPPVRAAESESQRERNSAAIRSRFSPEATATRYGRVFDHDGAVMASVRSSSITDSGTGLSVKSRVVRLEAANSTHCSFVITLEIYLWLNSYTAN
jgi:hypothetical protein